MLVRARASAAAASSSRLTTRPSLFRASRALCDAASEAAEEARKAELLEFLRCASRPIMGKAKARQSAGQKALDLTKQMKKLRASASMTPMQRSSFDAEFETDPAGIGFAYGGVEPGSIRDRSVDARALWCPFVRRRRGRRGSGRRRLGREHADSDITQVDPPAPSVGVASLEHS